MPVQPGYPSYPVQPRYPMAMQQPMARMPIATMPAVRSRGPGYLPQNFFPGPAGPQAPVVMPEQVAAPQPAVASPPAGTVVEQGPTTEVVVPNSEVIVTPAQTATGKTPRGPAAYFDVIPGTHAPTIGPNAPVAFHRKCEESMWIGGEYLLSWMRRGPLDVPLLTTSTAASGEGIDRGAIGEPGTIVLFGGNDLPFGVFSGVRLEAGIWLDHENRFSIDASGFYLFPRHIGINRTSTGADILTRPIFNVGAGEFDEDVFLIGDNDFEFGRTVAGNINIDARAEMYGGEFNGRFHSYVKRHLHCETLVGFRSVRLVERISIVDTVTPRVPGFVTFRGEEVEAGNFLMESDRFATANTFYGFQVGGRLRWEGDWFFLDAFAKVGIGLTYQNIEVEGSTKVLAPNGRVLDEAIGGVLALQSNIGESDRTRFGVIPELGINMGVELTDHLRLKAGYSFMLWSGVARPGLEIDRAINPAQAPGAQQFGASAGLPFPRSLQREQAFWLHTLNFGVEFHY